MPNHAEFKRQCGAEFSALVFSVISVIFCSLCVGVCVCNNVGSYYYLSLCRSMSKKHNTPFQSHHAVEFSLRVCERSAGTIPNVVTTVCSIL